MLQVLRRVTAHRAAPSQRRQRAKERVFASHWLPLTCLSLLLCIGDAHGRLAASERSALVDLYLSTEGPMWRNNTGWSNYTNPNSDPCIDAWFGVVCSSAAVDSHVVYVAN